MSGTVMSMWTIYRDPADMPGKIVGRKFLIGTGPNPVATTDYVACDVGKNMHTALQTVRDLIQRADPSVGIPLPRNTDDEPHIVETWI